MKSARKKAKERPRKYNTCHCCDEQFEPVSNSPNMKYCSVPCRTVRKKETARLWREANKEMAKRNSHNWYEANKEFHNQRLIESRQNVPTTYMAVFPDASFYIGSTSSHLWYRLTQHWAANSTLRKHANKRGFNKDDVLMVKHAEHADREEAFRVEMGMLSIHLGSASCINIRHAR